MAMWLQMTRSKEREETHETTGSKDTGRRARKRYKLTALKMVLTL